MNGHVLSVAGTARQDLKPKLCPDGGQIRQQVGPDYRAKVCEVW